MQKCRRQIRMRCGTAAVANMAMFVWQRKSPNQQAGSGFHVVGSSTRYPTVRQALCAAARLTDVR